MLSNGQRFISNKVIIIKIEKSKLKLIVKEE